MIFYFSAGLCSTKKCLRVKIQIYVYKLFITLLTFQSLVVISVNVLSAMLKLLFKSVIELPIKSK